MSKLKAYRIIKNKREREREAYEANARILKFDNI